MISMEEYMDIKVLHRDGLSIREIARRLGIDRRTVKRHLEREGLPAYERRERQESKLEEYYPIIKSFLEEDAYKGTWIYDKLKKMGYQGSYDLVRRYVQGIKGEMTRLAYVRFETEPGRQAQVDWGEFQIENSDGTVTTLQLFLMILGYSRALYVELAETARMESLLDCHIRAFEYLQGVPGEILYDNMKTITTGREGGKVKFTVDFLNFARHYDYMPRVCPPYSPWVKGKIERPVDYVREQFWRGYRFCSIAQTNQDIRQWLETVANERIHGTHHQRVRERWEQERPHLLKLSATAYDTSLKVFRKVQKDCQISYNGNRYVMPYHVAGKPVMLKIKAGQIRCYYDEELLVTYTEPPIKGETVQDPRFYEQLLADQQMRQRKYGKGRAVCQEHQWDVEVRPLSEYQACAEGDSVWTS